MLTGTVIVPIIVLIGVLAVTGGISDENYRRAQGVRRAQHHH